ncbi:MAG: IclR family transcriptional regulator [Comamonadaceae bacterium]|nr:MAG: IclR family transcriptional regulator [Comamonadaceae bacterium]
MPAPTIRPVPAVRRANAILHYLAEHGEPRGVSRIARDLQMLPSTCLHILRELASASFVNFMPTDKTWSLGPGVLTLARRFVDRDRFALLAQSHIDRIGQRHGVKATASVYDGHRSIVVVAVTAFDDDMQVQVRVGRRVPMLASSTGRCIAAFNDFPLEQLKQEFAATAWQTPLGFAKWRKQLPEVKAQGLAVDEGWYRKGMTLMSAPVCSPDGSARRFIGILGISAQIDGARRQAIGAALVQSARVLEQALSAE